jgi:VWFA-related protein
VLFAIGTAAVLAAGQTPQTPVFRAGVDHVAVDVVVTDNHDKAFPGLTKDDFEIVEQGQTQTISDFSFVAIPGVRRAIDPVAAAAAPKPDVVTNTPPAPTSRAFVMVIDALHIVESDIIPVKRVVTEFVQSLSSDDEAAIVFTNRSDLSVDLTRDISRLLGAADHVRDAMGFGRDALGQTTPSGRATGPEIFEDARRADSVLQNIADSLAGSAFARRAIIYVSDGSIAPRGPGAPSTPPTPTDYFFLKDIYEAARRSDVAIYTIDPRGLTQPERAVRGGIGAIGGFGQPDGPTVRASIMSNIRGQQDRLRENAEQTGGRAFVNMNDLPRAVDELVADNSSFYMLGYYPNPFAADGKFHPISVKVKRPGLRVRARAGYVASAAVDASAAATGGSAVATVIGAGVSVADVSLRVTAAPLVPTADGMSTIVTIDVTYPAQPAAASDTSEDDVHVMVVALEPDGKVRATVQRAVHIANLPLGAQPITIRVHEPIDLPAESLELRVGASSHLLGRSGSTELPIVVPNPAADKLQLGGVVIGLADDRHVPPGADDTHGLAPFPPTTERTFSAEDTLRVFVPVFWGRKDASATVAISVPDSSIAPRSIATTGTETTPDHRRGVATASVPLAGLKPGAYGLKIEARLPGGDVATRLIQFFVR